MKKMVYNICIVSMIFSLIGMFTFLAFADTKEKVYKGRYDELLSKKNMYMFEKHMMQTMVDDFMWLALTKPKNSTELSRQIIKLQYKKDGVNEGLKIPSETATYGGDCEDMTLFVISRLLQCHMARIGFILFCPENFSNNEAHICAVSERPDKQILVIDATVKVVKTLPEFLKMYKKSKFEYYRIHWLFEDNSQSKIMKIVK